MSKPVTFILKNEALNMSFGKIVFNGKFVFELDDTIPTSVWKEVGFIPLEDNKKGVSGQPAQIEKIRSYKEKKKKKQRALAISNELDVLDKNFRDEVA